MCEIKRVQLCPKYVAIETQRGQNGFLLSAGPRVGFDIGKSDIYVLRRLRQARGKIGSVSSVMNG